MTADQFCRFISNVNNYFYLFYYSICLNLFRYFELFTADLHFSELCGIHRSVTLSRIHSLHQMNEWDFLKLKSSVKDISYPFIQVEYHFFLPLIITLPLLRLFSKNKKSIIVLKIKKYQPRNTKGFIAKKNCIGIILRVGLSLIRLSLNVFICIQIWKKWDSACLFFNKTGLWQLWIYKRTKHAEGISQYTSTSNLPGADPAFVIRGGPNSEHFLSNLRKILKRGNSYHK